MTEALTELAESDARSDVAIAREAVAGDYAGAYDSLIAEAETDKLRTAERYRQAARLIAPFAPSKALAAYKEATELDPEHLWSWIELGRLHAQYDTLASARNCFRSALPRVSDERDRMVLHNEFGNVLMAEGRLGEARQEFAAGLAIAERLAAAEPGNAEWQRDLFVGNAKLAQVAEAEGDVAVALGRFRQAEAVIATLAGNWPDHPGFARDLADVRAEIARLAGAG